MTSAFNIGDECPRSYCRRELVGSSTYRDLWCVDHGPVPRDDTLGEEVRTDD